jgi:hypothetical protein
MKALEPSSGKLTPMRHYEPDEFLRLGKRPSDSPANDPPGFPKR